MSNTIHIAVQGKIASTDFSDVVTRNTGYTLCFAFDEEWEAFPERVAVAAWEGGASEVFFRGNECQMPSIDCDGGTVLVGVYAISQNERIASSYVRLATLTGAQSIPSVGKRELLHEQILNFLSERDWSVFDNKVQAGTYSSLTVNEKGLVVRGENAVEVGETPSEKLADGGLFVCNASETSKLYRKKDGELIPIALETSRLPSALKVGEKSFDGSEEMQLTKSDLGLASAYVPKGSCSFSALPTPVSSMIGFVYNVTDAFETDARFLEGVGKSYPSGTNVVVAERQGSYYYDVLGGFVDLSSYALKSEASPLSAYPVGSIYLSVNSTSPSQLFGGVWERLTNRFLIGAGGSYSAGTVGGNTSVSHSHEAGSLVSLMEAAGSANGGGISYLEKKAPAVWSANYQVKGADYSALSKDYANGVVVAGSTEKTSVSVMPPYLAVYMWKRTA
ncbi:MAG: hypothetical protein J6C93_02180 [Clostridia bacterium]|nr:hypothetical protein [Clostridia bacterium]